MGEISARVEVARGIQAGHSFEAYTRVINGTLYRFVAHRSVYGGGHAGIQAYRQVVDAEGVLVKSDMVLSVGEKMRRGW